ncbi:MAG: branched-chain amino acid transporter permease protein [Firmicutes bacterium]|nr:branched-chain amino acid transporter permease protein [Bacillota bacterium]
MKTSSPLAARAPKKKQSHTPQIITGCVILAVYVLVFALEQILPQSSMIFTVLKKGAAYALAAVSLNLLNGFTGLFSLGQAGFMLIGAYTYCIVTIPVDRRAAIYQYFDGGALDFTLPVVVALILAGLLTAFFAWLIGLPVLRLKSDYLAIATLGFAEIIRAVLQWSKLGPITNGSNVLREFPNFNSFNIKDPATGQVAIYTSTLVAFLIAGFCIALIVLLVNSTYGRAFKAIRDDEISAEAMGINLAKHKMLSFVISSFFAGIGGAMLAMFMSTVQAKNFTSMMTYEILLIVVIGGIGSITGSIVSAFLFVGCSEWWLRFLDNQMALNATGKIRFVVVFLLILVAMALLLYFRNRTAPKKKRMQIYAIGGVCIAALIGWLIWFQFMGSYQVPLLRNGFRAVVFAVAIMGVVLFFSKGIMGSRELPDLFRKPPSIPNLVFVIGEILLFVVARMAFHSNYVAMGLVIIVLLGYLTFRAIKSQSKSAKSLSKGGAENG